MFDKATNERLTGLPVTAVTPAFIQSTAISFGDMSMIMPSVLLAVSEAAKEASADGTTIRGQENLFSMPELDPNDGRKVMELLNKPAELNRLIAAAEARSGTLIGSELNDPALKNLSVIAASYTAVPGCTGSLALIGPLRMNYPRIVATLLSVADIVGESLSELLDI